MKRIEQYDVFSLPVSQIYYDADFNCRGQFTLQSVEDLAKSIKGIGLQFPVVVQPVEEIKGFEHEDFRWRLIAGHRRFRAVTTFLKWTEIPATVWNGLSERQARLFNFTENLERQDLNVLEEARVLGRLFPKGAPIREAARELKRDTRWVHARFRLLKLPEPVQVKVAAGTLSLVDVEVLRTYPNTEHLPTSLRMDDTDWLIHALHGGEKDDEGTYFLCLASSGRVVGADGSIVAEISRKP